ncbi:MAG TPA: segregation and condensation protein A [Gammaproteobacteria bacterium]
MDSAQEKELKILVTLRQVLSSVVREITPEPGMRHPLSEGTMQDLRNCFTLIASREKELNEIAGMPSQHRPRYVDEPQKANVVKLHGLSSKDKKEDK